MRGSLKPSTFRLSLMQRLRRSWTSWLTRSRERRLVRVDRRQELLLLEAERLVVKAERLRLALQVERVTHSLWLERLEQLRHPEVLVQPIPVQPPRLTVPRTELLPEELEPMPSAEEQLGSLLAGPLMQPPSPRNSPS